MAVIEFGPLSPLYNIDRSHVVNFLVGPFNIVCGEGYGLKKGPFKLHAHYCLKIGASCEENKDQNGQRTPTKFFTDCHFESD